MAEQKMRSFLPSSLVDSSEPNNATTGKGKHAHVGVNGVGVLAPRFFLQPGHLFQGRLHRRHGAARVRTALQALQLRFRRCQLT